MRFLYGLSELLPRTPRATINQAARCMTQSGLSGTLPHMPEFTAATLQAQLPLPVGSRLCVALSGGLDSSVLLHAVAQLTELQGWRLRAVHVDHQLQALSSQWSRHCEDWTRQLGVECEVVRVDVRNIAQLGVEAAAREVRYAALRAQLKAEEVLLTAHHADDQLETVLLALMRGSGLDGLAAMPACVRFGAGWHMRPLLSFSRVELQQWARQHRLPFVDDPTNTEQRFDRNFLRERIAPLLQARWPASAHTASRSASHLAEAQALLNEFVAHDYAHAVHGAGLRVATLQAFSPARRRAVLRYWLRQHDVLMPATRVLRALEHDMLAAAEDRVPCTEWSDAAVYRYRGQLYLERRHAAPLPLELNWRWREPLALPNALGQLQMRTYAAGEGGATAAIDIARLPDTLTVRFRRGGERIRLGGEAQHRELKKLLHTAAVLPWQRGRLPLIYAGNELIAVADLWVDCAFAARGISQAVSVVWQHGHEIAVR